MSPTVLSLCPLLRDCVMRSLQSTQAEGRVKRAKGVFNSFVFWLFVGLIHNLNIPLVSGCIFFFLTKEIKGSFRFCIFLLLFSHVSFVCCGRRWKSVLSGHWCCSQSSVMDVWESIGDCCSLKNGYQGGEIVGKYFQAPGSWVPHWPLPNE